MGWMNGDTNWVGGGGGPGGDPGGSVDPTTILSDTTISTSKTWSSTKINKELTDQKTLLSEQIATNTLGITNIRGDITTLNLKVGDLEDYAGITNQNIDKIAADVLKNKSDISTLKTKVAALEAGGGPGGGGTETIYIGFRKEERDYDLAYTNNEEFTGIFTLAEIKSAYDMDVMDTALVVNNTHDVMDFTLQVMQGSIELLNAVVPPHGSQRYVLGLVSDVVEVFYNGRGTVNVVFSLSKRVT